MVQTPKLSSPIRCGAAGLCWDTDPVSDPTDPLPTLKMMNRSETNASTDGAQDPHRRPPRGVQTLSGAVLVSGQDVGMDLGIVLQEERPARTAAQVEVGTA